MRSVAAGRHIELATAVIACPCFNRKVSAPIPTAMSLGVLMLDSALAAALNRAKCLATPIAAFAVFVLAFAGSASGNASGSAFTVVEAFDRTQLLF